MDGGPCSSSSSSKKIEQVVKPKNRGRKRKVNNWMRTRIGLPRLPEPGEDGYHSEGEEKKKNDDENDDDDDDDDEAKTCPRVDTDDEAAGIKIKYVFLISKRSSPVKESS